MILKPDPYVVEKEVLTGIFSFFKNSIRRRFKCLEAPIELIFVFERLIHSCLLGPFSSSLFLAFNFKFRRRITCDILCVRDG